MSKLKDLVGSVLLYAKDTLAHLSEYPLFGYPTTLDRPMSAKARAQWEEFLKNHDWRKEILKYLLWRVEQERKHERDDI